MAGEHRPVPALGPHRGGRRERGRGYGPGAPDARAGDRAAHTHANPHARAHAHADPTTHSASDANARAHTDADTTTDAHADPDPHPHADADARADAHPHTDADTHTHTTADAPAAAVSREVRGAMPVRFLVHLVDDERGVALMAALATILVLTLLVGVMALTTMGERTMSADQLRSVQALAAAEAGAYYALGELRQRFAVDLNVRVAGAAQSQLLAPCTAEQTGTPGAGAWQIVRDFAYPLTLGSTDWVEDAANREVRLAVGTPAAPVQLTDSPAGRSLGRFHATVTLRPTRRTGVVCQVGGPLAPERYLMWFDYRIVATGTAGNAQRTVCLVGPPTGAVPCDAWEPPTAAWTGSGTGFPMLIERAAYHEWALGILSSDPADSATWMYTTSVFTGPVHTNSRFQIWGRPTFNDPSTTQVDADIRYHNCGFTEDRPVTLLPQQSSGTSGGAPCDAVQGAVIRRVAPLAPPTLTGPGSVHPARAAVGDTPLWGGPPGPAAIRRGTSDLPDVGGPPPPGIYVMDTCGSLGCGGLYIQGDVQALELRVESGRQVIIVESACTAGCGTARTRKIVLDPAGTRIQACQGPGFATCTTYTALFNGMVYVEGQIRSNSANPANPGGLWGTVQRDTRLTIAASGDIHITDHLVYERPPVVTDPLDLPGNVLGLWSLGGRITIDGFVTPRDLYVDAAVLAPNGQFWVKGWDTVPDKGAVHFLGSVVQFRFGEFGAITSPPKGYGRDFTYDPRLRSAISPPFFPLTGVYAARRGPGVGREDSLYDRPRWMELGAP